MIAADAIQSTAASQPLLLAHNGDNYWWGSGVTGNYNSTPNAVANQITGDIEFIAKIDYKNSGSQCVTSKNIGVGSGQLAWTLFINGSNLVNLEIFSSAYTFATSSVSIGATFNGFLKVTRVASTGSVQFFTSSDGITYTQLGTTQSTTSGSLTNVNTPVNIGSYQSTNVFPFLGKIYRATISNSIGGVPVVDFNPATYNASTSQTQWTSATGEIWTISTGTATTGYKGVLVDRTIVQSDGIDDTIGVSLIGSGRFTQYLLSKQHGSTTGNEAIAGAWGNLAAWCGAIYSNVGKYATYQGAGADGVFGSTITKNIYTEVGLVNSSTGTDWIPNINGNDVTNGGLSIGVQNAFTSINIGSRQGGVTFSNSTINTYMMSNSADTLAKRTAMYNLLKSISNL